MSELVSVSPKKQKQRAVLVCVTHYYHMKISVLVCVSLQIKSKGCCCFNFLLLQWWSQSEEFQALAMRLAAKVMLPGTGWVAFRQLMDLVGLMMNLGQSPQSESTPRRLTLYLSLKIKGLWYYMNSYFLVWVQVSFLYSKVSAGSQSWFEFPAFPRQFM